MLLAGQKSGVKETGMLKRSENHTNVPSFSYKLFFNKDLFDYSLYNHSLSVKKARGSKKSFRPK